MNNVYLYDGEFSSLLALITELLKKRIEPADIQEESTYQPSLLEESFYLEIPNSKDNIAKLKKALPKNILGRIYYVYLSNHKRKEIILYWFIKYAIHFQEKVYYYRRIDAINEVLKISQRVAGEAHKLKGFVRFQELKNHVLYAEITPDNQVLPILGKHFSKRFPKEKIIIKDTNRELYFLYQNKRIMYLSGKNIEYLSKEIDSQEEWFEDLWKAFHKTIAIKERTNKKCQQQFMPKKYWKNILEMENEI